MARLNIEDCWWTDPRRSKLIKLLGSEDAADIAAIRMWRVAQEFWKHGRRLVPLKIWDTIEANSKLIQANLAEEHEDGVYVCGSSQYLEWVFEKREAAKLGGQKSAKRPRDSKGRLQKSPSKIQAESKSIQASGSSSGSSSVSYSPSNSEYKNTFAPEVLKKPSSAHPKEKSPVSEIRDAFLEAFKNKFKLEYPGWGAKENGMAANWLKSISKTKALEYVSAYMNWTDRFISESGHDFKFLVSRTPALDAFMKRPDQVFMALEENKQARKDAQNAAAIKQFSQSATIGNLLPHGKGVQLEIP